MAGVLMVTPAQVKAIFSLGNKLGMDKEDLHGIAYRHGKVESIKQLSRREAGAVIEELKTRLGQPLTSPMRQNVLYRATPEQQQKIAALVRELGWNDQPERLRGFVRRMCRVDDVRFLNPDQASRVIEALKAMQKGGRAERKKEA